NVVRNLEEPGRLELGDDAALQTAERVHERRLNRVLGLLARAELVQAVPVDLRRVALVEIPGRGSARSVGSLDTGCSAYGRDCGHLYSCLTAGTRVLRYARTANVGLPRGGLQPLNEGLTRSGRGGRRAPCGAGRTAPRARAA